MAAQFQHTLLIFYQEVECFTDEQWLVGISFFQVPVKQAMHLLDCLEFYFSDKPLEGYLWGKRYGGGWWELSDEQLPNKEMVLKHAREIEARILAELSVFDDADLADTFGYGKRLGGNSPGALHLYPAAYPSPPWATFSFGFVPRSRWRQLGIMIVNHQLEAYVINTDRDRLD